MVTSYSYLNQIFYIPNKFDGKTDFGEKYILNENNLSNLSLLWSKYGLKEKEEEKIENITPSQKDGIFWCFYIIHYGINHYYSIQYKHKNIEMEEKQKIVNFIQEKGNIIKEKVKHFNLKISNVKLKEAMSDLLLNKNTNYYVLYIMCIYYDISVIIDNHPICYHFQNESKHTYVIKKLEQKYELNPVPIGANEVLPYLQTKLLVPFDQEKPLKGVSSYKISDLTEIMNKLNMTIQGKKNELYNNILVKIQELQN